MKRRITALLMTALLVAGSMPATAADTVENKTANTTSNVTKESKTKADEESGAKTDTKSNKTTNEKNMNTGKLSSTKEQTNTASIAISTLEELQKIGLEEDYPLDGIYELQNDIDAGELTELPVTNQTMPVQPNIQKTTWNPIGTKDKPFTGEFRGNGHLILNLTIAPENGDAAFFGSFEGTMKDIAFVNLQSVSKTGNAALLSITMNGAEISNVLFNGNAKLQNADGTTYAAVDKKEAVNITARKANTATVNTEIGNHTEIPKNQAVGAQIQTQVDTTETERLNGDIAVEEKNCVYDEVNFIGDLHGELPKGVSQVRTNPEYISMMKGEKITIAAPQLPFALQFTDWELVEASENAEVKEAKLELTNTDASETEITGQSAGKALLKAVYQYGETTLNIETPIVVGEVISEVEELKPVDDVFYGQLEVVAELIPIDGVFPKWMKEKAPDIIGDDEGKEKILLFTWENFKNIGNTEYNPEYTMDADYILMSDIVSDGLPFTPIGTKENPFTGSFQGQNFMIDVTLNPEINVNAEYKGLFGVVK